jgi:hypothetical protein
MFFRKKKEMLSNKLAKTVIIELKSGKYTSNGAK